MTFARPVPSCLCSCGLDARSAAGQRDERVVEVGLLDSKLVRDDLMAREGRRHGGDDVARARHDQVGTAAAYAAYLRKVGQDASRRTGRSGRNRSRWSASTSRTMPAGVSRATTLPVSITAIRSASRSASSMKCVTRTTVTPRSRTPSISSQVRDAPAGPAPSSVRREWRCWAGRRGPGRSTAAASARLKAA